MRVKRQEQQQPQVFPLMILCTTRDDRDSFWGALGDSEPCASPSGQCPRASPRPADLRQPGRKRSRRRQDQQLLLSGTGSARQKEKWGHLIYRSSD